MPTRFRVDITRAAERDLWSIVGHIVTQGHVAASRWFTEMERQITTLEHFPKRCPVIPEFEELKREYRHLIFGQYRTIFRIEGTRVMVMRVIHGSQLLRLEGVE